MTVTWKVGDGPRFAAPLLICRGWTNTNKKCASMVAVDAQFRGRARVAQESPSLEITKVCVFFFFGQLGDDIGLSGTADSIRG